MSEKLLSAADVKMEQPVLVRSLKSNNILLVVAGGDGKFGQLR